MGMRTLRDLLFHIPSRYEDYSHIVAIADAPFDTPLTLEGTVTMVTHRHIPFRRLYITETVVEDATGRIKAVWFNQPYLEGRIKRGSVVRLAGSVTLRRGEKVFTHPLLEVIATGKDAPRAAQKESLHSGRLVAVYPETAGATSRWFRYIIAGFLREAHCVEFLPREILRIHSFPALAEALHELHFPSSLERAKEAKRRIIFQQLFLLQLTLFASRKKLEYFNAPAIPRDLAALRAFTGSLSYALTDAQRRSAWEIVTDLAKPHPMNRLLEGDVGSGKTVVAAAAIHLTAGAGYQSAYLAPTEILAEQHFRTLSALLTIPVFLLTNSLRESTRHTDLTKSAILKFAQEGETGLFIGTHALIQKDVRFGKLGLVIVDEQHRFGVAQRRHLLVTHAQEKMLPHLLSMSATPIPRTLAMTLYGDLDLSVLDELPKGRKEITTDITSPAKKQQVYAFMREEIKKGRQAFVVCPRIEKGEEIGGGTLFPVSEGVKNVSEVHAHLAETIFPDLRVGMLHGKMRPKEKEEVMKRFVRGEFDILVATSVIEVGVDIPNASVMLVESADRFGLAQLYQLRGRIGRGTYASSCFFATELPSQKARARLQAILRAKNGFELAEEDLKLRGPGDFFGTQQSGLPNTVTANLMNAPLVYAARETARKLLEQDPMLTKHPLLKQELVDFRAQFHRE